MSRRADFEEPQSKFAKVEDENVKLLEMGIRLYELDASEFPKFRPNDNPSSDDILINVMKFCAFFKKKMGSSTNDTIFSNITDLIVLMTGVERRLIIEKMSEFQLLDWVTNYEPGQFEESPRHQNYQHFQQQQNQHIEMPSGSPADSPISNNFESTSSLSEEMHLQQPSSSSSAPRVFVAQIVKKPPVHQTFQRVEKPVRCVMKSAHHIINKLILQYPYAIFTWESFLMDIPSNMSSFPTKLVNIAFSQLKEQKLIHSCDSKKSGKQLYIIKETRVNCLHPLYLYGYSTEDYIGNMITHCKQQLLEQLRNFDYLFPQPENGTDYFPVLMNTFSLAIMQFPSLIIDLTSLQMVNSDMASRALNMMESHNIITVSHENEVIRVQKLTDISQIEPHIRRYGLTIELFMKMLKKSMKSISVEEPFDQLQTDGESYSPLQYFPLMAEDPVKPELLDFVVVKQEEEDH